MLEKKNSLWFRTIMGTIATALIVGAMFLMAIGENQLNSNSLYANIYTFSGIFLVFLAFYTIIEASGLGLRGFKRVSKISN